MNETVYEIAAITMRYFFVALIVYILIRVVHSSLTEFGVTRRLKARMDKKGGMLGDLEIVAPEDSTYFGQVFVLKRENVIGRAKRCDISLNDKYISPVHAAVYEKKGAIYLSNYGRKAGVLLNGEQVKRDQQLSNDDLIELGRTAILVHIYEEE